MNINVSYIHVIPEDAEIMPVAEDAEIMPVAEFIEHVELGALIDYDGYGYPVRDGKMASLVIQPSVVDDSFEPVGEIIPPDATHIAWFNR